MSMTVALLLMPLVLHNIRGEDKEKDDPPLYIHNMTSVYMMSANNEVIEGFFTGPPPMRNSPVTKHSINYTLYTRSHPDGIMIREPSVLKDSSFDPKKQTKFITHGWMSSGDSEQCVHTREGYIKNFDVNVIVVDWRDIAGGVYYFAVTRELPKIARYLANFIDEMVKLFDLDPIDIHLIGHSLGAQISGLVGCNLKDIKLGRVTGLDPAYPGFEKFSKCNRISEKSAEFVDIIHTCGGFLGLFDAVGHVDFYPNGGLRPQPGCSSFTLSQACSHSRSWEFFAESVMYPDKPFYGLKCNQWSEFRSGGCDNETIPMGEPTPRTARGRFFLKTRTSSPYAKP